MSEGSLVTIRGLVESEFDIPVRSFSGVFAEFADSPAKGYAGTRIDLRFADLEDVVCAPGQVYNLPTFSVNIGLSNKKKSRWGYFGDSLAKFLASGEDIQDAIGRRMSLVFTDGLEGRPEPAKYTIWQKEPSEELLKLYPDKMIPTAVWVVTGVEGSEVSSGGDTSGSTPEYAEANLIGKTRAEFNKWAFADARIRKDPALLRSITDKSFVNTLLKLGRVVEDGDGVFQLPS